MLKSASCHIELLCPVKTYICPSLGSSSHIISINPQINLNFIYNFSIDRYPPSKESSVLLVVNLQLFLIGIGYMFVDI